MPRFQVGDIISDLGREILIVECNPPDHYIGIVIGKDETLQMDMSAWDSTKKVKVIA